MAVERLVLLGIPPKLRVAIPQDKSRRGPHPNVLKNHVPSIDEITQHGMTLHLPYTKYTHHCDIVSDIERQVEKLSEEK